MDTTLVAGMFFEALLDASRLPGNPRERVSFVRKRIKDYVVDRLAGQITLSHFYHLLNLIEVWVTGESTLLIPTNDFKGLAVSR